MKLTHKAILLCASFLLLGTNDVTAQVGSFTFTLDADSVGYGSETSTIMIFGELKNESAIDVMLDVNRIFTDLPIGWLTTICTDICYPAATSNTILEVEAGDSAYFDFSFYTTSIDTGYATMFYGNWADSTNTYLQQFTGITTLEAGAVEIIASEVRVEVYPNPTSSNLSIKTEGEIEEVTIYNLKGEIMQKEIVQTFSVLELPVGVYLIDVRTNLGESRSRFMRVGE